MPKGPVIQDMSILGKGGNLNKEVFSRCPKFPHFQAIERGARMEEGNPFTQVSW